MKTTIQTGLATILLLAISCKKENNAVQSTSTDNSSKSALVTNSHEPAKYDSIVIGTQKWMTKNLDVTHYRNGGKIPQVKGEPAWRALRSGAWCWYDNNSANGTVYGRLYNWYAVNDPRGLAPTGWHVPSKDEWHRLSKFLGNKIAGGKLKDTGTIEAGTGLWHAPNAGATNETGFTGLPGGSRSGGGTWAGDIGYTGSWWSSTQDDTDSTAFWYSFLNFYHEKLPQNIEYETSGLSVRCIKDKD